MLSFVYFDHTHCGYIFDKDVEDLIYTLGLNFSRSQVKKLVSKAVTRDSLLYRKLTDKPKEEEKEEQDTVDEINLDWHELACGNRKLLPVFESGGKCLNETIGEIDPDKKPIPTDGNMFFVPFFLLTQYLTGLVVYKGAVVDIDKLLTQLDRSEKARIETEQYLLDLKSENGKLTERYSKSSSTIKHLNSELKEYKEKLRNTEDSLGRSNVSSVLLETTKVNFLLQAHSKLFQTTLMDIRDKIEPVLKTASHKDEKKDDRKDRDRDGDKKKDRDDAKSRWEKEKDRESSRKETSDRREDVKKEHDLKKDSKEKDVKKEKKDEDTDTKEVKKEDGEDGEIKE